MFAAVIFVVGWSLAYLLLPEGLLRGRTAGAALAGDQAAASLWLEWLRILAINLTVAAGVFVAPNLLRTPRGIALGNVAVLVMVTLAAVVTGTNSFSVQTGTSASLAPSLEILTHPGPYELVAYLLATASRVRDRPLAARRAVALLDHQSAATPAPTARRDVDRTRGGHAGPGGDRSMGGHGHHQRCWVSHQSWPCTRGMIPTGSSWWAERRDWRFAGP